MKKITLIVQAKDTQSTLRSLRNLGVVHVEHQNIPSSNDLKDIQDNITRVSQAIAILVDSDKQDNIDEHRQDVSKEHTRTYCWFRLMGIH